MLETGLEGVKGRGGGVEELGEIYLNLPAFPSDWLIITDSVINSDFKTMQHRYKENEFWPLTINVLMIVLTEVF